MCVFASCFLFYCISLPYYYDMNRMVEKNTTDKNKKKISQHNTNIPIMPSLALSINVYFTVAHRNIAFVPFYKAKYQPYLIHTCFHYVIYSAHVQTNELFFTVEM